MNERLARGLRKHIRTELQEARANGANDTKINQIKKLRNTYRILKQEPHMRQAILEPIPAVDFAMEAKARDINLIAECKNIYDFIQSVRQSGIKDYAYTREDAQENRRAIPIVDFPFKSDYITVAQRFGAQSDFIGEPGSLERNYAYFFARTTMMDLSEKFMVRGNISRDKINL